MPGSQGRGAQPQPGGEGAMQAVAVDPRQQALEPAEQLQAAAHLQQQAGRRRRAHLRVSASNWRPWWRRARSRAPSSASRTSRASHRARAVASRRPVSTPAARAAGLACSTRCRCTSARGGPPGRRRLPGPAAGNAGPATGRSWTRPPGPAVRRAPGQGRRRFMRRRRPAGERWQGGGGRRRAAQVLGQQAQMAAFPGRPPGCLCTVTVSSPGAGQSSSSRRGAGLGWRAARRGRASTSRQRPCWAPRCNRRRVPRAGRRPAPTAAGWRRCRWRPPRSRRAAGRRARRAAPAAAPGHAGAGQGQRRGPLRRVGDQSGAGLVAGQRRQQQMQQRRAGQRAEQFHQPLGRPAALAQQPVQAGEAGGPAAPGSAVEVAPRQVSRRERSCWRNAEDMETHSDTVQRTVSEMAGSCKPG